MNTAGLHEREIKAKKDLRLVKDFIFISQSNMSFPCVKTTGYEVN
jgi:hypothetical protein